MRFHQFSCLYKLSSHAVGNHSAGNAAVGLPIGWGDFEGARCARYNGELSPLSDRDLDPPIGECHRQDDERRRHAEDDDVGQRRLHGVLPLPLPRRLPVPAIFQAPPLIPRRRRTRRRSKNGLRRFQRAAAYCSGSSSLVMNFFSGFFPPPTTEGDRELRHGDGTTGVKGTPV